MGSTTAAGTALAISAAAPATYDATGFAALTFTEIGGIEKIGAIGAVTAEVEFKPLKGAVETHKGSTNYGTLQPSIAHDEDDAGQTLLRTAAEPTNNAMYSYKVTLATGGVRYSRGRVFGYPETIDGADSILMANPTIKLSTPIVKVDAP